MGNQASTIPVIGPAIDKLPKLPPKKDVRNGKVYSIADQVKRFANAKATNDKRYLDITTVYDGSGFKDLRVLITGAEQGLGLEVRQCLACAHQSFTPHPAPPF